MGAFGFLRRLVLCCAATLAILVMSPCRARCSQAILGADAVPTHQVEACPRTLFLETVTVRVYETSDNAENMLHAACLQASVKALAHWRAHAFERPNASLRACAAQMGAQGCLTGQPFTQPRCTNILCPLTQKCVVRLVHL